MQKITISLLPILFSTGLSASIQNLTDYTAYNSSYLCKKSSDTCTLKKKDTIHTKATLKLSGLDENSNYIFVTSLSYSYTENGVKHHRQRIFKRPINPNPQCKLILYKDKNGRITSSSTPSCRWK